VKAVTVNWTDIYEVEFCNVCDPAGVITVISLYGGLLGKRRSDAEMFCGGIA
jgi:hypothetical protein